MGQKNSYIEQYRLAVINLQNSLSRDLTIEDLQRVISDVRRAEALKTINQNPISFTESDFFIATEYYVDHLLLSDLREEIAEERNRKGSDLTQEEMINTLNQVYKNRINTALNEINADPQNVSFEFIERIGGWIAKGDHLNEYRQALFDKRQQIGELLVSDVNEVIYAVNKGKILAILNSDINLLEYKDFMELIV